MRFIVIKELPAPVAIVSDSVLWMNVRLVKNKVAIYNKTVIFYGYEYWREQIVFVQIWSCHRWINFSLRRHGISLPNVIVRNMFVVGEGKFLQ